MLLLAMLFTILAAIGNIAVGVFSLIGEVGEGNGFEFFVSILIMCINFACFGIMKERKRGFEGYKRNQFLYC